MGRRVVWLAFSIALLPLVPSARQTVQPRPASPPALTFRSAANYVEVDATVTDAAGDPVRDLNCADFDVREDGRARTLDACGFVDLPVGPLNPPPLAGRGTAVVEPDVVTNEKRFDGRVYMILLDGFHVAVSRSSQVRAQATKFIDQYLGENDLGAVVQVGNPAAGQEFTANKRLLRASIARFTGQALPSETQGINADALYKDNLLCSGCSVPINDAGPTVDKDRPIREFMARESLDSMRRLAEYLGELSGRKKAMLLFSEGIEVSGDKGPDPLGTPLQLGGESRHDYDSVRLIQQDMIAAATRNNVSIYAIDPRGLSSGAEDTVLLGPMPTEPIPGSPARAYANPLMAADLQSETRRAQDSLRTFAEETGGLALVNQNDMGTAFDRVVRDNSAYYVLGYASPDPRHDGRYHRISVKVRRPGAQVRLRSGYFAPTDAAAGAKKSQTPPDPVTAMLRSPAPIGGLGMHASVSVLRGPAPKCTIHMTVEFNGQDVALKSAGDRFTNDIDVEYLALDMKGLRQAGGREVAHLNLKPATRDAFPENGVRYVTEFELLPGRYQLRVGAVEHVGGRTGSVFDDLDVPDFTATPLAMNDLLLTASSATRTPTPVSILKVGALLPAPTTTAREFSATDTLTVAAGVCDNDQARAHQVDLSASVRSEAGTEVFQRGEHKDSGALSSAVGGFNWVLAVPLAGLAPGRYVLTVEARSTLGGMGVARKETEFIVK